MKYLVLYRDLVESADGLSHLLGAFDSRLNAHSAISADIAHYCDSLRNLPLTIEENDTLVSLKTGLDEYLCDWEIVQIQ